MSLYSTEAIVLRSRDLGEADRIVTLYTRRGGKVQAIARGARRTRNRLRGATQVFTHCRFLLFAGRSVDTVSQCEIQYPFTGLRNDLLRMVSASCVAELVDELVREGEPQEELFELLLSTFRLLERSSEVDVVLRVFEARLLSLLGYRPQLERCVNCGYEGEELEKRAGFSAALGGVLCFNCLKTDPKVIHFSTGARRLMREFIAAGQEGLDLLDLTPGVMDELDAAMRCYISYRVEKDLNSWKLLDILRK